ncbi:hypothetical protein ILUMI_26703 [Ignelater luminosus]|uniref:Digestive organ expansion factor homolog n=1 Tax=Ignelater luminosus TaxID=2038154 RepID=A0A8K0FYW5_IGNLU|nr:hypothetical protein ILUMI_26703 [Ignelater luminosus]
MAPRGKFNKSKHRSFSNKRPTKSRNKRNKSINLHQIKSQKRKHLETASIEENKNTNLKVKRQKIDVQEQNEIQENSSSDEEEDQMRQLLSTFDSNLLTKNTVAIESSDDSDLERENDDIDNISTSASEEELNDSEEVCDEEESNSEMSNDDIEELTKNDEKANELDNVNSSSDLLENQHLFKEEDELDAETQKEDDDLNNLKDPFAKHLFYEMNTNLLASVQNTPMLITSHSETWPVLGQLQIQIPKCEEIKGNALKYSLEDKKPFATGGTIPVHINLNNERPNSLYIKTQIIGNIRKKFPMTSLQNEIFSIINNYQDLYYTQRTFENAEEIRFIYSLHIVNHILKTRTKVLHHNAKLNKKDDVPEEFRDQGLVRPKILVIVPFRDSAYRIISMLIDILIPKDKGNVMNKNRFIEEFTGHEIVMPKKNPKPEDYEMLFRGNSGDDFRIGITVTKKSLKLFADFYSSDIIIASPLGLRTIIGAEGETERNFDFLASIELLILDQTEIFMMQNWDHLLHIFNHMHLQPKESHGTNFSRVRTWSLHGLAKYYRQTLIFSSFVLPEINAIFNKKCFNYAGKIKTVNAISVGSICQVFVQLPHVFHKFAANDVSELAEARFNFFVRKILPQQRDTLMRQTLIFVSNYFDYVKLRNYFKKEDIGFVQICEYSKEGKVARARDMFFHGDAHFLLYTERFHFFNRVRIKGIRHLIFYQPPIFPHFYYEMCNLMQEGNMNKKVGSMSNMTVTVLYSKYDANQLAAIVGTERAAKMVNSDRNVHMLVTDGK